MAPDRLVIASQTLWNQSFAGFAFLQFVLALALFVPAGTLRYWQAWVYLGVFLAAVLVITVYFLRHDPDLHPTSPRCRARGREARRVR